MQRWHGNGGVIDFSENANGGSNLSSCRRSISGNAATQREDTDLLLRPLFAPRELSSSALSCQLAIMYRSFFFLPFSSCFPFFVPPLFFCPSALFSQLAITFWFFKDLSLLRFFYPFLSATFCQTCNRVSFLLLSEAPDVSSFACFYVSAFLLQLIITS